MTEGRWFWRGEEVLSWLLPRVGAPSESRKFTTRFRIDDRGTLTASRVHTCTSKNTLLLLRISCIDSNDTFGPSLSYCS
jgi:hypothetical protein